MICSRAIIEQSIVLTDPGRHKRIGCGVSRAENDWRSPADVVYNWYLRCPRRIQCPGMHSQSCAENKQIQRRAPARPKWKCDAHMPAQRARPSPIKLNTWRQQEDTAMSLCYTLRYIVRSARGKTPALILIISLLAGALVTTEAQTFRGTILGTVSDS